MTKAHLTEQNSERDAGNSVAAENGDIYGLPPHLYWQIKSLRYGDADGVAYLLSLHREFAKKILGVASPQVGLTAVQKAIAMSENRTVVQPGQVAPGSFEAGGELALESTAPPAPAASEQHGHRAATPPSAGQLADIQEFTADNMAAAPAPGAAAQHGHRAATPPNAGQLADIQEFTADRMAPEPAAAKAKGPELPWVVEARSYNTTHAAIVAEFNDLTMNTCAPDEGQVDPQSVAAWQAQHGLAADGKVGPHTVAAARHTVAKAGPASAQDARIPV